MWAFLGLFLLIGCPRDPGDSGSDSDTATDSADDSDGDTDDNDTDDTDTGECDGPQACPTPSDPCMRATCHDGVCGEEPAPATTGLPDPHDGDCLASVCDGAGAPESIGDLDDVPADAGECSLGTCAGGPGQAFVDAREPCSGGVCDGDGACVECVDEEQCSEGSTCDGDDRCAPSTTATTPEDGDPEVAVETMVRIVFSEPMDATTLAAQVAPGACAGTIRLSHDDFATCVAFAAAAPILTEGGTIATLEPAQDLLYDRTYRLAVTTGALSAAGVPLAAPSTTTFTTDEPKCTQTVVISQAYGGGGNSSSVYKNDFIELFNGGDGTVRLDGCSVQYTATTGTTWQVTPLSGSVAPGRYYLVRQAAGAGGTTDLPTADATGTIAMGASGFKVAFAKTTSALTGACPTADVLDFVGASSSANCWEGGTKAPAPSNTHSVLRRFEGCQDLDDNGADFVSAPAAPRNSSTARTICVRDIDVDAIPDAHGAPAVGVAGVEGVGLVRLGVSGVRIHGQPAEVTEADAFHLGSETKAMTATLAAVLVEEGVLAWETTLASAFPDLTVHPALAGVTLEQLLTHTGGLTYDLAADHPTLWQGLWDRTDPVAARAWLAEQLLALPPDGTPGTHLYSNAGYIVAGAAMEVATGESWEDLLTERVLSPLGMDGCGFGAPLGAAPWGHRIDGSSLVPMNPSVLGADNPVGLGPAGTVHCPLADWAAFVGLHLRGGRGEDTEILAAASFARMHAPQAGGAAMGWYVTSRSWAAGPVLTHTGSNNHWFAEAWLDPEGDQAFLATSNAAGTRGPAATDAAISELMMQWKGIR